MVNLLFFNISVFVSGDRIGYNTLMHKNRNLPFACYFNSIWINSSSHKVHLDKTIETQGGGQKCNSSESQNTGQPVPSPVVCAHSIKMVLFYQRIYV